MLHRLRLPGRSTASAPAAVFGCATPAADASTQTRHLLAARARPLAAASTSWPWPFCPFDARAEAE
eukprot:371804-Alexandrium_andersonii.AAC.1